MCSKAYKVDQDDRRQLYRGGIVESLRDCAQEEEERQVILEIECAELEENQSIEESQEALKSGNLVRNAQASLRGDGGTDDVGIIHTSPCSGEEMNSIIPRLKD